MSKDRSNLSYYIGSSLNMKRRYNRHMSNLNHKDTRNSQANPKFYNYVRKYGRVLRFWLFIGYSRLSANF